MVPNLDFSGHNTRYATHGLHSYAAKCPPQLVRYGIEAFSQLGDIIFDPMVGSGTTLVESKIQGRNAIGFDLDPLACLIARVKSRVLDDQPIANALSGISKKVTEDLEIIQGNQKNHVISAMITPPDFPNRDYWFSKPVHETLLYSPTISKTHVSRIMFANFYGLPFLDSTHQVSVANARDIIHCAITIANPNRQMFWINLKN